MGHSFNRPRLLLFALALFLTGCTAVPNPTPTIQSLAAATIAVARTTPTDTIAPPTPSLTATPSLTPLPTASATTTRWPTVTRQPTRPATSTPTPHPTRPPSPAPERDPTITFGLSHLGQLFFLQNGILHIKRTPASTDFLTLGDFVITASWSPDGRQLLYSQVATLDPTNTTYDQRLWSAENGSDVSLTDLIPAYPQSGYRLQLAHWTPDGRKILYESYADSRHEEFMHVFNFLVLSVVDFQQSIVTDVGFMDDYSEIVWQTNDLFVERSHCGSPCKLYITYDYSGNRLFARRTAGLSDFTTQGNWMLSPGGGVAEVSDGTPHPTPEHSQNSVEAIDLATGAVTLLWEDTTRPGTIALLPGHISPDGQFVSFNFASLEQDLFFGPADLFVIDRTGRELLQHPASLLLAWHPDNHLIVAQQLDETTQQLIYLALDGTTQLIHTETAPNHFIAASWSPDGRSLAYITDNPGADTGQLYLWQPSNSEPLLVHTASTAIAPHQITWLPDSSGFYFAHGSYFGLSALYLYRLNTATPTLIAATSQ